MTIFGSIRRRVWLLPLVLGALVLRAFMPGAGFSDSGMAGAGMKTGYDSTLCSTLDGGKPESLQAPGEDHSGTHCEFCVAPLLGAPLAHSPFDGAAPLAERVIAQFVSQVSEAPLARAQSARAPPRA